MFPSAEPWASRWGDYRIEDLDATGPWIRHLGNGSLYAAHISLGNSAATFAVELVGPHPRDAAIAFLTTFLDASPEAIEQSADAMLAANYTLTDGGGTWSQVTLPGPYHFDALRTELGNATARRALIGLAYLEDQDWRATIQLASVSWRSPVTQAGDPVGGSLSVDSSDRVRWDTYPARLPMPAFQDGARANWTAWGLPPPAFLDSTPAPPPGCAETAATPTPTPK